MPRMRSKLPLLLVLVIGASLAGCANNHRVLSLTGACDAFSAPEIEIAGRTPTDQKWIDGQVEGGVGACSWPRPKPRPLELDRPSRVVAVPAPVKPKPKKKPLWKRLRHPLTG